MKNKVFHASAMISSLILMFAALPQLAPGSDVFVSPTGDGSAGTSWATAFPSLQNAIVAAQDGDAIHVRTGRYDVVSQIDLEGKSVTIRGGYVGATPEPGARTEDPSATVFDGGGTSRIFYATNCLNLTLECLSLSNGYFDRAGGAVYGGAGIYLNKTDVVLRNCLFLNNRTYGYSAKGAAVYSDGSADTIVLDGCVFRENTVTGGGGSPYAAAVFQNGGYLTMVGSVLYGSTPGCVATEGTATGHYAVFSNCLFRCSSGGTVLGSSRKTTTAANCTIADNDSTGLSRGSGNFFITNSIVWHNRDDIAGTVFLSYSCVSDPDSGTAVIHDDPQFTEDYYLSGTSPCIDQGGGNAAEAGLNGLYTQIGSPDTGVVDLGYHHPAAYAPRTPDLHVDATGGSDANAGTTPGQALRTITRALALAESGTRIHVAAGTYDAALGETFPLNLNAPHLHLLGADARRTIIDANGTSSRVAEVLHLGSGSTVGNLTFSGGIIASGSGAGLHMERTAARFSNLIVHGCQIKASGAEGGGIYVGSGWPTFTGCTVTNNTYLSGAGSTSGGGVGVRGSARFSRCFIAGNRVSYNGSGGGLYFNGATLDLDNTLITANSANNAAYADGLQMSGGTLRMINTTVAGNLGIGVSRSGGTIWATNSIFWSNGVDSKGVSVNLAYSCISNSTDYVDGGHNVASHPRFKDEVNGDYRLSKGSPCIHAGFYEPWMKGTTDLAGLRRVMGGGIDLGAYEWAPPGGLVIVVQ